MTTAMKLAAYDMYSRSMNDSAVNWNLIQKDYPDIKIRTFPKEILDSQRSYMKKSAIGSKSPITLT